ncbi:ABC transporter permease [Actinotalea sp. Marseille-Q4924]|uniref:ABC transporter permease n=1 Tax=Actinotalea sp. Marseille-Q4924 TaxID=2866571 RepID=UPI001CE43E6D|nr:ABC transporter permease [Actinotalea sp. Marseille-Q4924]
MSAALRTEYRKIVTTRLWWVLLATTGLYMAFLGGVLAFALALGDGAMTGMPTGGDAAAPPPLDDRSVALAIYTLAPALGYVFPVVVGALSVTGEFRHMTITPTLLAEPRRSVVLAAKLLASVPVGLLFGVVGTVAATGAGAAVLGATGHDPMLTDPEVLTTLARSVLALTVWAVVGVGFGSALTNQVAGIVVILAFTQLVEPTVRIFLGAVEWGAGVARWLPGAAGEAIAGSSFYSATGIGQLLPWWQGLLVLVAYGVVLAAVGRATTFRRDVT